MYGEDLGQSQLREVIDTVSKELHLYDSYDRLIILQALNKVYLDEIKFICRSGDYSEDGIFFEDLDEVWCEAILLADLNEVEAINFKGYLEKWLPEANEVDIEVDFKMSFFALEEGWHTPHIKRILSGGYSAPCETPDEIASAVAKVRLVILEQQSRYVEFKHLARYENFASEISYIETLIK